VRNLLQQYEFWQPRARYKTLLDPTAEEVKKLCQGLRRSAKEERILLHYNGHGVPRPTRGGEIWCFNRQFTQYIPVAVVDVAAWIGTPILLIVDSSAAGNVYEVYHRIAESGAGDVLLLVACGAEEVLPMAPEMPADIFTACLTTPMEIAIRWHVYRAGPLLPAVTLEMAMGIPGRLGDRRTPLGELNWILTATTDTIAWTVLPRPLFKRLFRQDVLVASLFRNYLLAVRIMKSFRCTPSAYPPIPAAAVVGHELWPAWDQALDCLLAQHVDVTSGNVPGYEPCHFFAGQMDAFEVWIEQQGRSGAGPRTSLHLPIILQVLLSQVHRQRALGLMAKFASLGEWAVLDSLHVGVFPYLLKLLQSPAPEIRGPLLQLWLRILWYDGGAAVDLLKEDAFLYFVKVVVDGEANIGEITTAMACLARLVMCIEDGAMLMASRAERLPEVVRQRIINGSDDYEVVEWAMNLLAALGGMSNLNDVALLLTPIKAQLASPKPANRVAAIHLLGVLSVSASSDLDTAVELTYLLIKALEDCHPIARRELVISMSKLVACNPHKFILAAYALWASGNQGESVVAPGAGDSVRHPGLFTVVWKVLLVLALDPAIKVSSVASRLVDEVHIGFLFSRGESDAEVLFVQGERPVKSSDSQFSDFQVPDRPASTHDHKYVVTVGPTDIGGKTLEHHEKAKSEKSDKHVVTMTSAIPLISTCIDEALNRYLDSWALKDVMPSLATLAQIKKATLRDADETRRWHSSSASQRKFDQQVATRTGPAVNSVVFHPLHNQLILTDESGVTLWDWERKEESSISVEMVSSLRCVDWDPVKLVVGTADGIVRLYGDDTLELKSAWNVGPGDARDEPLLLEWSQPQRHLYSLFGGNNFSVFDAAQERFIRRMTLDSPASAICCGEEPVVTVGFRDGWIRRFDLRTAEPPLSIKAHTEGVLALRAPKNEAEFYSAGSTGEILLWDTRSATRVLRIDTRATLVGMDLQRESGVLAAAGSDATIRLYEGDAQLGSIKYHEGLFLAQRLGAITAIAFHPRRLLLAAAETEGLLSIYSPRF
jgi:regulator-associated protein of mTOR